MVQDIYIINAANEFNSTNRGIITNPSGGSMSVASDVKEITIIANETGRYDSKFDDPRYLSGDTIN